MGHLCAKQEPVQSDIVDVLKFVRAEYAPLNWFFDSGGAGGKLFMTTLQRDHGFPLIEASEEDTDRREDRLGEHVATLAGNCSSRT